MSNEIIDINKVLYTKVHLLMCTNKINQIFRSKLEFNHLILYNMLLITKI